MSPYAFLKVVQAELVGFGVELGAVHASRVQDDVGALGNPVPVDDVIGQGPAHGEVHHGVEA